MNETLTTIADRYTCRDFADTPLTEEQIKALVEAALAAPSAMNLQPWHVVVVTDKTLIDDMDAAGMGLLAKGNAATYERMMSRGGKLFYNAPCMIYIAADATVSHAMDCGIMSQNIALAAHSLGLGSCICGMAGVPLSEEFIQKLQFHPNYEFSIAVLVGTPKTTKAPHEIDLGKVTYIS